MKATEHDIESLHGHGGHNGEYDYICTKCGARDWIASYGTLDQLDFYSKPCKEKNNDKK